MHQQQGFRELDLGSVNRVISADGTCPGNNPAQVASSGSTSNTIMNGQQYQWKQDVPVDSQIRSHFMAQQGPVFAGTLISSPTTVEAALNMPTIVQSSGHPGQVNNFFVSASSAFRKYGVENTSYPWAATHTSPSSGHVAVDNTDSHGGNFAGFRTGDKLEVESVTHRPLQQFRNSSSAEERPTSSHSANTSAGGLGSDEVSGSGGTPGSSGNTTAKSRYRGVSYDRKKAKWRVQIKVAALGKSGVSVGYFDTEEAAARAYDRAAIGLLGHSNPSLQTNFPTSDYSDDVIPQLTGKSREEVKNTLKNERIKQAPRRRFTSRQRTSRFMGVGSSNRKNQWQARILVHGKVTHLGYYETEEDAAKVYDRVSLALHGEGAQTNFPSANYCATEIAPFRGLDREDLQRALGVKPMDKSSRYRGVSKKKGKWEAKVMVNRRWAYRELFDSEEEAARAYDRALWRLKPKEAASYVNFKDERPPEADEWAAEAAGGSRGNGNKLSRGNVPGPVHYSRAGRSYDDSVSDEDAGDEDLFDAGEQSDDDEFRYEYKPIKGTIRSEKMRAKKYGSAPNLAALGRGAPTRKESLGRNVASRSGQDSVAVDPLQRRSSNSLQEDMMQNRAASTTGYSGYDFGQGREEDRGSSLAPAFVPIPGGGGLQLQFGEHTESTEDKSMMMSGMVPSNISEPSRHFDGSYMNSNGQFGMQRDSRNPRGLDTYQTSSLGKRSGIHRIHSEPHFSTIGSNNIGGDISIVDLLNLDMTEPLPPLTNAGELHSGSANVGASMHGGQNEDLGIHGNLDISNLVDWMHHGNQDNQFDHINHFGRSSNGVSGNGHSIFGNDDEELLANLEFNNPRPRKMSKSMSMTQLSSLGGGSKDISLSQYGKDNVDSERGMLAREARMSMDPSPEPRFGSHAVENDDRGYPSSLSGMERTDSGQPLGPLGRPIRRTSTFTSSLATFDERHEEKLAQGMQFLEGNADFQPADHSTHGIDARVHSSEEDLVKHMMYGTAGDQATPLFHEDDALQI